MSNVYWCYAKLITFTAPTSTTVRSLTAQFNFHVSLRKSARTLVCERFITFVSGLDAAHVFYDETYVTDNNVAVYLQKGPVEISFMTSKH